MALNGDWIKYVRHKRRQSYTCPRPKNHVHRVDSFSRIPDTGGYYLECKFVALINFGND